MLYKHINFAVFCAFRNEALEVIKLLKLKKQFSNPFQFFSNGYANLIISGIGKTNMACAVRWFLSLNREIDFIVNFGSCGHSDSKLGNIFKISVITENSNDNKYYPNISLLNIANTNSLVLPIVCVDKPEINYPKNQLVDMESAGFFLAAEKFIGADSAFVIKYVSDNKHNNFDTVLTNNCNLDIDINSIIKTLANLQRLFLQARIQKNKYKDIHDQIKNIIKTKRLTQSEQRIITQASLAAIVCGVGINVIKNLYEQSTAKDYLLKLKEKSVDDSSNLY